MANTKNAGIDGVSMAFVIYRSTSQIVWALANGDAQDEINLRMSGETFDLLG